MEDINRILAENLTTLRTRLNLSLGEAAKITGVSKSLLSQIERGEVNPTIGVVWKIADGLKVSFSSLTTRPEEEFEVVGIEDIKPVLADQGRLRNFPLFGTSPDRRFELFYLELDPEARLKAKAHPRGCREFLVIFSGQMTVTVDGRELTAGPGQALRFIADRPHTYANSGPDLCRLSMVIHYADS